MRALPVIMDLSRGRVIVVGATPFALSKLEILLARGACISWFPLSLGKEEAQALYPDAQPGNLEVKDSALQKADLTDALAIVTAADDQTNSRVAHWAREMGVPVNAVDNPQLSSFIFPAIIDRGDVVVAVSTGGASPVLARRLRAKIEAILPARIAELAAFLGRHRDRLRRKHGRVALDRSLWEDIIDGPVAQYVLQGDEQKAERLMDEVVQAGAAKKGSVALVGAGPGDPDLLTLRAFQALQDADVIFYDALVTPEILARARRDARKILVGKRKGSIGADQKDINRLLILEASAGHRVVRLKGGDPFIFGRGGEEMAALQAANIPVSIVPGITAALGCAAEAEIPLTYRDEATRLVILTAHHADEKGMIHWEDFADAQTTLVIYMGLSSTEAIRDGLIAAGRASDTPVAILARGTRNDAASVTGRLDSLPLLAAEIGDAPALLIIGSVVTHSRLWREQVLAKTVKLLEVA